MASVGRPLQLSVLDGAYSGVVGGFYGGYAVSLVNYRPLCTTPCTLYLRPGTMQLRVGGYTIRPYVTNVDVPPTGADLRLRAPSAGGFYGGYLMTTSGAGLLVSGVTLFALAHFEQQATISTTTTGEIITTHKINQGYLIGGGVLTGIGALMMGGGIALLAVNRGGVASDTPHGAAPMAKVLVGPGSLTVKGQF